jgi:hypothetical protein
MTADPIIEAQLMGLRMELSDPHTETRSVEARRYSLAT